MSKTVKKATAVVGCAMLASSAVVAPAMAIESNGACDAVAIQDASQEIVATESHDAVSKVIGTFAYTQDSLSSNEYISGIFSKAAATLCASLPDYAVRAVTSDLMVRGVDGLSWTGSRADARGRRLGQDHRVLLRFQCSGWRGGSAS